MSSLNTRPFKTVDKVTGKDVEVRVQGLDGDASHQSVHIGTMVLGLEEFLKAAEHVLLADDVTSGDVRHRKWKDFQEMYVGDGRGDFGAKRLRVSVQRARNNTAAASG